MKYFIGRTKHGLYTIYEQIPDPRHSNCFKFGEMLHIGSLAEVTKFLDDLSQKSKEIDSTMEGY